MRFIVNLLKSEFFRLWFRNGDRCVELDMDSKVMEMSRKTFDAV
jgi:hypothetical protein